MMWITQFVIFPRSLTNIKGNSRVEKECLSFFLALQHFEVYLTSSFSNIVVFSDHNPLTFIHKMKNKNQRLLRWILLLQEYNLTSGILEEKITPFLMPCPEHDVSICGFL